MEILNIEKLQQNAIAAYKAGTDREKTFLEKLFGKNTFGKQGNVIGRIKSIEDVFIELNENFELFQEKNKHLTPYKYAQELAEKIAAAYNEGWWPKFTKGEKRWFPVFDITGSGFVFSYSYDDFDYVFASVGAGLVFENEAKSTAAGKLFASTVYKNYLMNIKK